MSSVKAELTVRKARMSSALMAFRVLPWTGTQCVSSLSTEMEEVRDPNHDFFTKLNQKNDQNLFREILKLQEDACIGVYIADFERARSGKGRFGSGFISITDFCTIFRKRYIFSVWHIALDHKAKSVLYSIPNFSKGYFESVPVTKSVP